MSWADGLTEGTPLIRRTTFDYLGQKLEVLAAIGDPRHEVTICAKPATEAPEPLDPEALIMSMATALVCAWVMFVHKSGDDDMPELLAEVLRNVRDRLAKPQLGTVN